MGNDLVFATNNEHKLREIREIIGNAVRILGLKDIGLDVEIPETGDTLEENARQKARFVYERTGRDCFADDTGLEIEALGGRPGVYSARYAGEGCTFADNVRKVLQEMEGMENRKAQFRCVICLITEGREHLFEGSVRGRINDSSKGSDGFGYDPVFIPDGHRSTFAEMPPHLKNGISHRGRAVHGLLGHLRRVTE